jgi:hypothetical protein
VPAAPAPSFIPDEPFGGLEESAFAKPTAAVAPAGGFASMTEEESATLLAPPAPEPSHADAASTVMFRAGDLPWNAQPVPPAPERPPLAVPRPAPVVAPVGPPEPVFVPEAVEAIEEPAVFEEVLEEDLDFGAHDFEPEPEIEPVPDEASGALLMPADIATLPPMPQEDEEGVTGAFEPVTVPQAEPAPAFEPELTPAFEPEPTPAFEPEPTPAFEPEPTSAFEPEPASAFEPGPASAFEPEPASAYEPEPASAYEPEPASVYEFEPAPVFGRETMPAFEPSPGPAFEPEEEAFLDEPSPAPEPVVAAPPPFGRPPVAPESFADVVAVAAAPAPPAPPPSEAAAVSVPVEMVEKIAQRVVAQISEKAVREIAWEVIPDLAEALIKQEIERLKAELLKI